jgi:hypothetical protein
MLSPMHPARVIRGCARHIRATLIEHRLFGKVRFADVAEDNGKQVEDLCTGISKETEELETVVADAASDGKFTPEECDTIVGKLRKIVRHSDEGRIES